MGVMEYQYGVISFFFFLNQPTKWESEKTLFYILCDYQQEIFLTGVFLIGIPAAVLAKLFRGINDLLI